ncbi:MAG TPA: M56 family metallopeptidase [Gammaproteobacteria bacterium]|nr:M56 family metallopeptidase [Gammaproteobacteria bacterium]
MSALEALHHSPLAYHLGWTLVHFLWQGALTGAIYGCLRYVMKEASPQSRYLLSLTTLAALALLPVVTFIYLLGTPVSIQPIVGIAAGGADVALAPASASPLDSLSTLLHPLVPWTVPVWSIGVALLGFKAFVGWRRASTLVRRPSHEAPAGWQDTVLRLAVQIGVRMQVRLMVTARVAVPCVVGWLKPVILLPPAALSGLTTLQLEMVLAHELSHIRRHDYLVNLLQVAVETLLFYHPVVRWVSHDARRERELCCDDCAVRACGDALHYAHALTDLAALRRSEMTPAMGVTGGDLAMRIERLIRPHNAAAPRITSVMLASALCLSGMLAMVSARHLPFPMPWRPNLALPQALGGISTPARAATRLEPTRLEPNMPSATGQSFVNALPAFAAFPQEPVTAPAVPPSASKVGHPDAAVSLSATAPVHIGGAPLSSLLKDGNSALSANKRATAQIKVIGVNSDDSANAQLPAHEYCEPITGSRVCN